MEQGAQVLQRQAEELRLEAEWVRRNAVQRKLAEHQEGLVRLVSLPRGWDGEGAEPPSQQAAAAALSIVAAGLGWKGLSPSRVDPSVEGGVVLEYHGADKRYCLFECFNDDGIVLLFSLGKGDPRAFEVDFCKSTSESLWSELDQFCAGEGSHVSLD